MESFSQQWEDRYRSNTHLSIWPWSDLVSYVYRYARPNGPGFRVLELGPGAGANISLFKHLGADYHGVEGSATIVATLRERFPEFKSQIIQGDFIERIPFEGGFDLVVDRAALTHNATEPIRRCISNVKELLKPGGTFIGIDWFSTRHSDFAKGESGEDSHTRTHFAAGQFKGVGRVHFSDEGHLKNLLGGFEFIALDHKIVETMLPVPNTFASWNFTARKEKI